MTYFVSMAWVKAHLGDPKIQIVDATVFFADPEGEFLASGQSAYDQRHLPGAIFYDQLSEAGSHDPIPFTLPSEADLRQSFEAHGFDPKKHVVIYDSGGQVKEEVPTHMWASRLAWQLFALGFEQVSVMDGGIDEWEAQGNPISRDIPDIEQTLIETEYKPGCFATLEEVARASEDEAILLIDSLEYAQYAGEIAPFGESRAGHIPTARHCFYGSLTNPKTGTLYAKDKLSEYISKLGIVDSAQPIIVYCGFGIAACLVALILRELGYKQVSVYDGSLMEWATQTDLPLVTHVEGGEKHAIQ